MSKSRARHANETLVASGLIELALGALTGWPYALAIDNPDAARRLGVRSVGRLRQWHLDLIALGALTVLVGSAVPDLPRRVAWPLALGAWTNANAFGVLALRPELKEHPVYKASAVASFATVSWGCCGLAAVGVRRRLRAQSDAT
jgi:hypothetical protein